MTIWRPDPKRLDRPSYLSLAAQISEAIRDGLLPSGTRLPTHRALADELAISVQTVSRAYEELSRRGLVAGEVGRGTYVRASNREPDPPYLPERLGEMIDLSILKPVCEPMHLDRMKQALAWLSETLPASSALSFRPNMVLPRHCRVATEWLSLCGLEISPQNICITNGASSGMTVALLCVAPPGSTVATEAIGHHTLVPLARYLGFSLEGIETDRQGILPEALDQACRRGNIRAAFIQPSAINPHAALMGEERRRQIAEIARKHDIAVIENDPLGPLVEGRAPPIAHFAPERTLYITSFSKITVPGLRLGYLAVPDRYVAAAANRHLVTNWMATPMLAEIASKWVTEGTAIELVRWQRATLQRRQEVAAEILAGMDIHAHPNALHIWVELPEDRAEEAFVARARVQGVAIAPGISFRIAPDHQRPAVRVAVGSTTEAELRTGLGIIYRLLQGDPEHLLLAI